MFAVFYARKPLLIVGDEAFDVLYGETRIEGLRLVSSLRIFRPIRRIRVDLSASKESIARSVLENLPHAYAAIFPARYEEAAKLCSLELKSLVLGLSRGDSARDPQLLYAVSDRELDFYRAGRAAALYSSNVILSVAPTRSDMFIESFKRGFRDSGNENLVFIVSGESGFLDFEDYGCIVIADFEKNKAYTELKRVPLILFTWMSPLFLPKESVLSFDDSVWAQLNSLHKLLIKGQSGLIPSHAKVFNGRFRKLYMPALSRKGLYKALNSTYK
ncbi:hypothetical protein MASR2M78_26370 [Treponema sp.]